MQRKSRRSSNTVPIRPLQGRASSGGLAASNRSEHENFHFESIPQRNFAYGGAGAIPTRVALNASRQSHLPVPATPLGRSVGAANTSRNVAFTPMGLHSLPETPRITSVNRAIATNSTVKKDTRPLSDKAYQRDMVMKIVEFLRERSYNEVVAGKDIHKLNMQQFCKIFNFMLSQLSPNLQLSERGSREEEILNMCRLLRYPGNVTKQILTSIGTLHAVQHILGLLSWMVSLCSNLESPPSFQQSHEAQETFQLQMSQYHKWMDTEEFDKEAIYNFTREKLNVDESRIRQLETELEQKEKELAVYSTINQKGDGQRQRLHNMSAKKETLQNEISDLEEQIKCSRQQRIRTLQQISETQEKCEAAVVEAQRLREQLQTQQISVEEARQFYSQLEAQKLKNAARLEELADIRDIIEKKELDLAHLQAQEAKVSREVRTRALAIGVNMDDFENIGFPEMKRQADAKLQELDEKANEVSTEILRLRASEDTLTNKLAATKSELRETRARVEALFKESQQEKLKYSEEEQKLTAILSDLEQKVFVGESDLRQKQEILSALKAKLNKLDRETQTALDSKQNELAEVKKSLNAFYSAMKKKKEAAVKRYIHLMESHIAVQTAITNGTYSGNPLDYMPPDIQEIFKNLKF